MAEARTEIHLYGSLRPDTATASVREYAHGEPLPVGEILERLSIPMECVQLVMVNGKAASPGHTVSPCDRVALFPPEYAVFCDWKDFRR